MTVKVTVASDGRTITIETEDIAAAVALVNGLHSNGVNPGLAELPSEFQARKAAWEAANHSENVPAPKKRKPRKAAVKPELSDVLTKSWIWLNNQDTEDGTTPTQMGDALALAPATASWRLRRLVDLGAATQVGRGHYRATW